MFAAPATHARRVSDAVRLNVGSGHSMAPFGDFIDQNVRLAVKGKVKISGYLREFENRSRRFYGVGVCGGAVRI